MNRFLNAAAYLTTCGAICFLILAGLAFTPSSAVADDGSPMALACPCVRCDNECIGTTYPCTGSCNSPDAGCQTQHAICNCNCGIGDKTDNCNCF